MWWKRSRSGRARTMALVVPVGALLLAAAVAVMPAGVTAQSPTPAAGGAAATATAAAAPPADFTLHGFPNVVGSANYTPGTAATITAAGQTLSVGASFYKNPAKIDLLNGPPSAFTAGAGGDTVLVAFAFRVTDTTSSQLVGSGFGSQFQYSFTSPAVNAQTVRFNVSSATPPAVTLSGPPTVSAQTASLSFGGATVGWLFANPAAAAAPAVAATAAAPAPAARATVAAAAVQAPPKGPIAVQAPSGRPAAPAAVVAAAPAAAPRLPSTGTGGLLAQDQSGLGATSAAVLLASLSLLGLAGALIRRRPAA